MAKGKKNDTDPGERARWPESYWWGWLSKENDYAMTMGQQKTPADASGPPPGPVVFDEKARREMAESAWRVAYWEPMVGPSEKTFKFNPPSTDDMSSVDPRIRDALVEEMKRVYEGVDRSVYREYDFEDFSGEMLELMQSVRLQEAVQEDRKRVENVRHGATFVEELEYEESTVETAGWELPEEERVVKFYVPPSPPPGPPPMGRGAFFVVVDGSGSMNAPCDTKNGKDRFAVASAVIWTFIKEAERINVEGRSHYVGIYGFDGCMYYPLPISEFQPQLPLHPLPSGNIAAVKRDFLRYWPDSDLGGGTRWMYTLPALVDDYITFGAGDVVLIADGDLAADRTHVWEGDAVDDLHAGGYAISTLVEDESNPTFLMKLQRFMKDNDSGNAYMYWVVPSGDKPSFKCHHAGCMKGTTNVSRRDIRFVGLDRAHEQMVMRCSSGHVFREAMDTACREGCPLKAQIRCEDCRYVFMVLGDMFDYGNRVYLGTSVADLKTALKETLREQDEMRVRKSRGEIVREGEAVEVVEDDEDD